ncbi:hypothetical protein, partial [Alistipes finegoldii]|uniref:hypothetical protein n=1 Tax=Alistipes finegoldii TaxID=214856 RepID=UPI00259110A8
SPVAFFSPVGLSDAFFSAVAFFFAAVFLSPVFFSPVAFFCLQAVVPATFSHAVFVGRQAS